MSGTGTGEADWDAQWEREDWDPEAVAHEAASQRWAAQKRICEERLGGLEGLRVVEVGAGRGTNALLYARGGAHATLLDTSPIALEQARVLFDREGVAVETVLGDAFDLPDALRGAFDVSMSFGLCEHFTGERRVAMVAAHLALLRPGGIAMLGVPNRFSPIYRAWMATLKRRGTWELGTEVPFSGRELRAVGAQAGGTPLPAEYGSAVGTFVDQGLNNVLVKLGRKKLRTPQPRIPGLDVLAYELLVPVVAP